MPARMPFTVLAIGAAGLLSACAGTPHQPSLALSVATETVAQNLTATPEPFAAPVAPVETASSGLPADIFVASAVAGIALPSLPPPPAETAQPPVKAPHAIALRSLAQPKVALDLDRKIRLEAWRLSAGVKVALTEAAQDAELAQLADARAPGPAPQPVRKLPAVPPLPTALAEDLTPLPGSQPTIVAMLPIPAPVPPASEEVAALATPEPKPEATTPELALKPEPQPQQIAEIAAPITPRPRPHHRIAKAESTSPTGEGGPDIPLTFELRR